MSSADLRRAAKLRALYEEYMAKADPEKSHKERQQFAQGLMDKELGPQWRIEIKMPEVTIIDMEEPEECSFFDKFSKAVAEEGLGPNDTEEPEIPLPERLKRKKRDNG